MRNISNCMSIGAKIDRLHPGLKSHAAAEGWWDGRADFDWCRTVGGASSERLRRADGRFNCGARLMEGFAKEGGCLEKISVLVATFYPAKWVASG